MHARSIHMHKEVIVILSVAIHYLCWSVIKIPTQIANVNMLCTKLLSFWG